MNSFVAYSPKRTLFVLGYESYFLSTITDSTSTVASEGSSHSRDSEEGKWFDAAGLAFSCTAST